MKNIFKIIKLAKPMHGLMLVIIFVAVLYSIFTIVTPLLSGQILDEVIRQAGNPEKSYDRLITLLAITLAATLLSIMANSGGERLGDLLAARIRKHLTEIFYNKALSLPQSYYDSEMSGKILNQLIRGINSIQEFMNTATNFIIPVFLQAILVIAILFYYNIALGVLMTLILPIYLWISSISTRRWGKKEEAKNKIEDVVRGRISEVIANIKLVKGYTNEKQEYKIASKGLSDINKIYQKQSNEYHLFNFVRELILYLILFATSVIIFYNALMGFITVGTVIILIQMVDRARTPLFGMSFILGRIQAAEAGSKEFFEILALKSIEDYDSQEKVEKIKTPQLEFKNVAFKYEGSEDVFKNVSFSIHDNEMVALVGPSGAGKTTIANLLLKFYEPTSGQILLNGKAYKDLSHHFVRENIALVFQENELFSSTIKENVAYGSKMDEERVISSLKKANAWEFVSRFKDGINTEVGERGIKLSGGQRQRVQIARAIYKDAPILILDEATSSLDAKSENEVSTAIENLVKNRLVIVIAHRFSTIQNATKVVVLHNKGIEAVGSPQELSVKPGIYADLLQYQIEGNKKLLKKFEIY